MHPPNGEKWTPPVRFERGKGLNLNISCLALQGNVFNGRTLSAGPRELCGGFGCRLDEESFVGGLVYDNNFPIVETTSSQAALKRRKNRNICRQAREVENSE